MSNGAGQYNIIPDDGPEKFLAAKARNRDGRTMHAYNEVI